MIFVTTMKNNVPPQAINIMFRRAYPEFSDPKSNKNPPHAKAHPIPVGSIVVLQTGIETVVLGVEETRRTPEAVSNHIIKEMNTSDANTNLYSIAYSTQPYRFEPPIF